MLILRIDLYENSVSGVQITLDLISRACISIYYNINIYIKPTICGRWLD